MHACALIPAIDTSFTAFVSTSLHFFMIPRYYNDSQKYGHTGWTCLCHLHLPASSFSQDLPKIRRSRRAPSQPKPNTSSRAYSRHLIPLALGLLHFSFGFLLKTHLTRNTLHTDHQ